MALFKAMGVAAFIAATLYAWAWAIAILTVGFL